jgi:hypothetical protein
MSKSELMIWLHDRYEEWQKLLDQIGTRRMDEPGVSGDRSVKDIVSQMTVRTRWLGARLLAALRGEPEPAPPWPANLKTDDEINAWIHRSTLRFTPGEARDQAHLAFQDFLKVVESLPGDVLVGWADPGYYLVWVGDQKFRVGEFFDDFRDHHEQDVRAWLAQKKSA